MSNTEIFIVANKPVYQRPYKTRQQRRLADKRKAEDTNEVGFLLKIAAGVVLLVIVALAFAHKGAADRDNAAPQHTAPSTE